MGSFHACYINNIEPEDTMSLDISVLIALMAMLGGAGSLWGPIIGAAILMPMKSYLKEWLGASAGLVGIDLIIYAPSSCSWPPSSPGASGGSWKRCGKRRKGSMALLKVQDLTKYFGGLRANDHISFQVEEGEMVGLIGPNGAGKTTLFNCIAGYYSLTCGQVFFHGKDVPR